MSYSFNLRAVSKAAAKAAVAAKFLEIAATQACHERDKAQALAVAGAFIDILNDDDSKDLSIAMNGHLAGQWQGSDVTLISSAAVSFSASLVAREAAQA